MSPGEKSPREQAVDLFVYAPIGLALEVRELLPRLVERGRGQVVLAQLIGRVAAERGRSEVQRNLGRVVPGYGGAGAGPATEARPAGPDRSEPPAAEPEADADEELEVELEDPGAAVDAVLPGYDELPAAEIVRELADLDPDQLEVIRRHEQANRRRITVLNKIDRLRQA